MSASAAGVTILTSRAERRRRGARASLPRPAGERRRRRTKTARSASHVSQSALTGRDVEQQGAFGRERATM
jgi:hypothetical protein